MRSRVFFALLANAHCEVKYLEEEIRKTYDENPNYTYFEKQYD